MPQVAIANLITEAKSGNLVSFPTDTVPALAVKPDRSNLIFAAKGRSENKPLILMGACAEDLWAFVSGSETELKMWQQTAASYWPGALTLVLPASDRVPRVMNPTNPTTIGLRVPDCAIACKILAETGPMATTSVNRSGQPPLLTIAEIEAEFPDVITLLSTELAGVKAAMGVPSTVAKWTGSDWEILRQGAVLLKL